MTTPSEAFTGASGIDPGAMNVLVISLICVACYVLLAWIVSHLWDAHAQGTFTHTQAKVYTMRAVIAGAILLFVVLAWH